MKWCKSKAPYKLLIPIKVIIGRTVSASKSIILLRKPVKYNGEQQQQKYLFRTVSSSGLNCFEISLKFTAGI
jgi:hypothetical protein